MALETLKMRQRGDYKFQQDHRTRWSDNDMYHHMNNSVYYYLFDSVVNSYLIKHCSLNPLTSSQIGLVVHSHCNYFAPLEFPSVVDLCLRVNKLGRNSVTYEIGVFAEGQEEVKAVGEFVHVFVHRDNRRPGQAGMAKELKTGLEKLLTDQARL